MGWVPHQLTVRHLGLIDDEVGVDPAIRAPDRGVGGSEEPPVRAVGVLADVLPAGHRERRATAHQADQPIVTGLAVNPAAEHDGVTVFPVERRVTSRLRKGR